MLVLALALLAGTSVKLIGENYGMDANRESEHSGNWRRGAAGDVPLPRPEPEALDARSDIELGYYFVRLAAPKVAGEDRLGSLAGVAGGSPTEGVLGAGMAQDWRSLVCAAQFQWPCSWALAVIQCESSGNPGAYNPLGPYIGLFQVLNGPYDPYLNAVEAHIQYVEWMAGVRQTSPWPSCPVGSAGVRP